MGSVFQFRRNIITHLREHPELYPKATQSLDARDKYDETYCGDSARAKT